MNAAPRRCHRWYRLYRRDRRSGRPAAAQDDDVVTLTVGLLQDLDSPNVTAGFLVSSFELWNLQYATLTDKAADDFETIPGLAESWEAPTTG